MSEKNILAFGLKLYHTVEQYRKSLLRFFMLSYVLLSVAGIYWLRPRYIGKTCFCWQKCLQGATSVFRTSLSLDFFSVADSKFRTNDARNRSLFIRPFGNNLLHHFSNPTASTKNNSKTLHHRLSGITPSTRQTTLNETTEANARVHSGKSGAHCDEKTWELALWTFRKRPEHTRNMWGHGWIWCRSMKIIPWRIMLSRSCKQINVILKLWNLYSKYSILMLFIRTCCGTFLKLKLVCHRLIIFRTIPN